MILLRWLAGVAFVIAASRALAAPSSPGLAEKAAQEFIARRYPVTQAGGRSASASGPSALAIRKVEALAGPGWTLGYVSNPDPAGYVLLRADDEVSAVKLYSDARCFANLPPGFLGGHQGGSGRRTGRPQPLPDPVTASNYSPRRFFPTLLSVTEPQNSAKEWLLRRF
ncbi:MAG: hypothetical protein ABSC03_12160 [Verrucomicrobiota bacterium]|jgi:hypothetical protein